MERNSENDAKIATAFFADDACTAAEQLRSMDHIDRLDLYRSLNGKANNGSTLELREMTAADWERKLNELEAWDKNAKPGDVSPHIQLMPIEMILKTPTSTSYLYGENPYANPTLANTQYPDRVGCILKKFDLKH